jgi:hypothetical protein
VGTLETGKRADVVAVGRDPIADVTALENVVFVMKDGRVVRTAEAGPRQRVSFETWSTLAALLGCALAGGAFAYRARTPERC